jgi:tetratricopeptide (TPR) repeat protein
MQFKSLTGLLLAGAIVAAVPAGAMMSTDPPPTAKSKTYSEGERLVKAKEYAKAIPVLEKALMEDVRDADANNLIGYSYRKMGNTQSALAYYQRALALNPNHKGANEYLGQLYVELKDLPKAEERLAKLAQLCPPATCEEYRDLKQSIDQAKAGGGAAPRTGS